MYNSEYFNKLEQKQQVKWAAKASQLRLKNIQPQRFPDEDLEACIWYGDIELRKFKQNPPHSFEQLSEFMMFHQWLIHMKREWIFRNYPKTILLKSG